MGSSSPGYRENAVKRRVALPRGAHMRLTGGMSAPDPTDGERSIADTGMFKRFVEYETELDETEPSTGSKGRWIVIVAIAAIIVIAVVVWLLTR